MSRIINWSIAVAALAVGLFALVAWRSGWFIHDKHSVPKAAHSVPKVASFWKAAFDLADVIPSGNCTMEVLEVFIPKRVEELTIRMQRAAAENHAWYLEYVKSGKAGEALPYHTNLGVSEKEYAEFLTEVEKRTVGPSGKTFTCSFMRNRHIVSIDAGQQLPLGKLFLHLDTGKLIIENREIPGPVWATSDREDTPIGPWEGYKWRFEKSDLDSSTVHIVSLEIFRLKRTGRIFWRIKDNDMVKGEAKRNIDLAFQHPPKGGK